MAMGTGMAIDTIIMMTMGIAVSGDGFLTMGATDMMTTTTLYGVTIMTDSATMATGGTETMMATAMAMVMDRTATMDMATAMVTKICDANILSFPIFLCS